MFTLGGRNVIVEGRTDGSGGGSGSGSSDGAAEALGALDVPETDAPGSAPVPPTLVTEDVVNGPGEGSSFPLDCPFPHPIATTASASPHEQIETRARLIPCSYADPRAARKVATISSNATRADGMTPDMLKNP